MRIEPPPSEPSASGASPAATAAPLPPLLPPGVSAVSHGLRVAPNVSDSVNGKIISSGTLVFPMITAPAARSRLTTSASWAAGVDTALLPHGVSSPPTSTSSLIATGTPEQRQPLAGVEAALRGQGLLARGVGQNHAEAAQLGIQPRDAVQINLEQRRRGDGGRGQHPRLFGSSREGQISHVHVEADYYGAAFDLDQRTRAQTINEPFGPDVLPLWIAEMDFPTAPAVSTASDRASPTRSSAIRPSAR